MKIVIIIVTFNGQKWIRKCLSSIEKSDRKVHIVVVDNNSEDKTVEIIKKEFPNVQLITPGRNLGFGQGNNHGIKYAIKEDADYVFLMNQDAWIEPDTISKLVHTHKEFPEFGILSPFHLDYNGENVECYFSKIIGENDCPGLVNDIYFGKQKQIYEIEFIHAAAWLISKDCINTVGGFDPIFPHYAEDNDYLQRLKYYKIKVGIVPSSKFYHYGSNETLYHYEYNFRVQFNYILLKLKDINSKFRGLLLVYLKTSIDKITSAIVYRRGKDFLFQNKLLFRSLWIMPSILKSRKHTKQKGAYLK